MKMMWNDINNNLPLKTFICLYIHRNYLGSHILNNYLGICDISINLLYLKCTVFSQVQLA